jgi:hypothetical protein
MMETQLFLNVCVYLKANSTSLTLSLMHIRDDGGE